MELRHVGFQKEEINSISDTDDVMNWPVVYVLNGGKEVYVGETCDIRTRLGQHLVNKERQKMVQAHIIYDKRLNKSATLDIEQTLIQLYSSEENIILQNRNGGQSSEHDYYNRVKYRKCIPKIWELLIDNDLAETPINDLFNSSLFKYSPYTALNKEQSDMKNAVLSNILDSLSLGKNTIHVVNGGAGTGKTLVALNILKALSKGEEIALEKVILEDKKVNIQQDLRLLKDPNTGNPLKVGLVVPMYSLRTTLQKVAKKSGLSKKSVLNPYEMVTYSLQSKYDVLIVDEAHRLTSRKGAKQNIKLFSERSKQLGLDGDTCTQLDWIKQCCRCCILFYDEGQTINSYDITPEQFSEAVGDCKQYELRTQMRCKGGKPFINYISDILQCQNPETNYSFENGFEFGLYEHVDDMVEFIRKLDQKEGLCRVVAGYSWEWVTKKDDTIDYDIEIEGHRYTWNMTGKEWIISENATRTIGCVHTTQGYDLNYVGLIFGREIDYDSEHNSIIINADLFKDEGVKRGSSPEKLKTHILNAYKVMMTRGINGCYVYAYNPSLRDYLKKYIAVKNPTGDVKTDQC